MGEEFLYFGYGSNISEEQMENRCPGAKAMCVARLDGFRVVERLYADVEPVEGGKVFGLVYEMNQEHLKSLDKYEGYPKRYTRVERDVCTLDGNTVSAIVYEMTPETMEERSGKKYPEDYRLRCRTACEVHGIVDLYRGENIVPPYEPRG